MSFLLSMLVFASMASYDIVWENDVIEIDLHEAVDEYKHCPKARLYVEGSEIIDPEMFYEIGVDRTFFSVVHSNAVMTHTVKYRVTFPGFYRVTSTRAVTFQIVDRIPPVITRVPEMKVSVGTALPDMRDGLVVSDNYDEVSDLQIHVDTTAVVTTVTGVYPVVYTVIDTSGNMTNIAIDVVVYDALSPVITQKKIARIMVGETFLWSDYLIIKDQADPFPDVDIDDHYVDWNTPGEYLIHIKATDDSGMSSALDLWMIVYDGTAPELIIDDTIIFSVGHDITDEMLLNHVILVSDDVDALDPADVKLFHVIDPNIIGTYEVVFWVSDYAGNRTTVNTEVKVVDDVRPVITICQDLIFPVGDPLPFWSTIFLITDNHSESEEIEVTYKTKVDMGKIGIYPLTVEAEDGSGNLRVMETYVHIVDSDAPLVMQTEDIVITDFQPVGFRSYFDLEDNYDAVDMLSFEILDVLVDYERTGTYPVTFMISDTSGNTTLLDTVVHVMDLIAPVIELSVTRIDLEVNGQVPDVLAFVRSITDNLEPLTSDDVDIQGQVDMTMTGAYLIGFTVSDASSNIGKAEMTVYVNDTVNPTIVIQDVVIEQGDPINLHDGVVTDDNSGHVTFEVFPEFLDTTIPGLRTITYVATDSRGNQTVITRLVEIRPSPKRPSLSAYVPMLGVTLLGMAGLLYLHKSDRKRY